MTRNRASAKQAGAVTELLLIHATRCPHPAPVLRLSWQGHPEIFCPGCGHSAPGTDTRTIEEHS